MRPSGRDYAFGRFPWFAALRLRPFRFRARLAMSCPLLGQQFRVVNGSESESLTSKVPSRDVVGQRWFD